MLKIKFDNVENVKRCAENIQQIKDKMLLKAF